MNAGSVSEEPQVREQFRRRLDDAVRGVQRLICLVGRDVSITGGRVLKFIPAPAQRPESVEHALELCAHGTFDRVVTTLGGWPKSLLGEERCAGNRAASYAKV